MANPRTTLEVLEVEDDHARTNRIGSLLESMGHVPSSSAPDMPIPTIASLRELDVTAGPSELLSRVRAFLPSLAASNADLAARAAADPNTVDIENVKKGQAHIRMDLGLGVFEDKSKKANGEEDGASASDNESTSSSDTSSSDDDDEEEDVDYDDKDLRDHDEDMHEGSVSSDSGSSSGEEDLENALLKLMRPTKPLPKRARPNIVVLDEAQPSAHINEDHGMQ